jgi:predicted DCC family thiol-disulfide oxidoreductase YuxK
MSGTDPRTAAEMWIVYDGECPFCSAYVLRYRIQQLVAHLHVIDARSRDPLVDEIRRQGFDLDTGMVVRFKGRLYHGADAMNVLAVLGSDDTLFNRVNRALFRRPRLAEIIYPVLLRGRLVTLRALGRPLLAAHQPINR